MPSNDKSEGREMPSTKQLLGEIGSAAMGGIVHSMIETPIVIPIEASITQTQINGRNFFWNFQELFRGGNLYRSLPTALIGAAPKAVIHYSWLVFYMNLIIPSGSMKNATTKESSMVGFCTGASEVVLSTPINFLKFRMQRPEWGYNGLWDAMVTVLRTEGPTAFWKGTLPTFCRNSTCMVGMLGGNKMVQPSLQEMGLGQRSHLVAGMFGGLVGSLMSYPFEMWRAARMHNRNFYQEMWSQGPKRMLAGWVPGATRLIITSAIMGELLPRLKAWSRGIQSASDNASSNNNNNSKNNNSSGNKN